MTGGQNLAGEVALVTGASRGIGHVIAESLVREGAKVALTARDPQQLSNVCELISSMGGEAIAIPADLEDEAALPTIIPQVVEHFGKLTLLINNAAWGRFAPLEELSLADFDRMYRINARAPFLLMRDALAPMRRSGHGTIINIASVVGHKGYPNQSLYGATKHALIGMSKALAREVQQDGIRVHTICPGAVATDMVLESRPDLNADEMIRPEQVAEAVVFLARFNGSAAIDNIDIRRSNSQPFA